MYKVHDSNPAQLETAPTGPGTTMVIRSKIDTYDSVANWARLGNLASVDSAFRSHRLSKTYLFLGPTIISTFSLLKAFGEVAVALHDLIVTDTDAECLFGPDNYDALARAGDSGVKKIPL